MPSAREIMNQAAGYRNDILEDMRKLTASPALGPTNGGRGEMEKAALVQGWLENLGLDIQRIDAPDSRVESGLRPNLAAVLPGGDGPARWALTHLDVVPPGDRELWTSDPWELRVEGDRLYGRGTLDDHAGLLASLYGLRALVDLGIAPPGPAGLLMVSDEETGSEYGLDYVLQQRPELFSPRDLIVSPDAGEPDASLIEVAEKSILWLKVAVTGKQVHGSTPEKGVNALYASARMMVAVREMAARFPEADPIFHPPASTFEPTRKEAGTRNINTIPGFDVFYIDCRTLPRYPLDEVERALAERFQEIAAEEGARVEITPVQRLQAPEPTPADAPVVKSLAAAIKQVRGIQALPGGVGGGTAAAFLRQRGLPAAVWCTWLDTPHMPDEYCLLADVVKDAQVFALFFAGA
jgi:succinyl-diaminopimelate desuccinylase